MNLLVSLVNIFNKNIDKTRHHVYGILDISFKSHAENVSQTRDDIFNIYMHGYINSKNVLFDNYVAIR